ncbi:hypothetical protein DSL72_008999 [Monilinia vaccinii-corymbosi]|uniref:Uncharacterized protein n=1 Tax=Monilinia vaccinii-corymbosi TaxID=61207 RepID=A0A8A3PPT0_9HELO|nr:hypothetical protein DSL72_008999 [Monilinia vaccinii-corymbosi]
MKRTGTNLLPRRKRQAGAMAGAAGDEPGEPATPLKFVIGVDYGTAFTSVSYYVHPIGDGSPPVSPAQILSIKNWPGDLNCPMDGDRYLSAINYFVSRDHVCRIDVDSDMRRSHLRVR